MDYLQDQVKAIGKNSFMHINFHDEDMDHIDKYEEKRSSIGSLHSADKGAEQVMCNKYIHIFDMQKHLKEEDIEKAKMKIIKEEYNR